MTKKKTLLKLRYQSSTHPITKQLNPSPQIGTAETRLVIKQSRPKNSFDPMARHNLKKQLIS